MTLSSLLAAGCLLAAPLQSIPPAYGEGPEASDLAEVRVAEALPVAEQGMAAEALVAEALPVAEQGMAAEALVAEALPTDDQAMAVESGIAAAPVESPWAAPNSRVSSLNGRFLLLNMHGALFHSDTRDMEENVAYARWMGAGVIRVFATDNNSGGSWSGREVADRIAQMAPALRAANVRLIVALTNNHRPVPGEAVESSGWMDGYYQLLLPFYTRNWREAYVPFATELIDRVKKLGALDVIFAWELGNELHTPREPVAVVPFITGAVQEIRRVDPDTPILPGTMGIHHLDPYQPESIIGRWLNCDAPVDGYTLHSYDWLGPNRPGDMPIGYDFDSVLAEPCPNGRRLPVIVEELGTSRELPGVYTAEQEEKRLEQESRQIRYVLDRYPRVIGIGAWNGESPKVVDKRFGDNRRGLTSYGPWADGSGSGYVGGSGARSRLEEMLRGLPARPGEWPGYEQQEIEASAGGSG